MLIAAVSCLVVLMVVVVLSFRHRYILAWKWKNFRATLEDPASGFHHDIFVIHGPTASFWVYGTLMEKLEGDWSYDCYAPERDLLAGEVSTEVICQKLGVSKQVVIVVTDCLLHSQWSSYSTLHAIHKSLTNSTGIVAITLTDLNETHRFPEGTQALVDILKAIKKISYPFDFSPMALTSHINGSAFKSDQINGICKTKCEILVNHSTDIDIRLNKKIEDEQYKLSNSSSSPNFLSIPSDNLLSSSSNSLPPFIVCSNIKCPKSTISKILSSQNSTKFKIKQSGNTEPKACGQFLHPNMILGSNQTKLNDSTLQENNNKHNTELLISDMSKRTSIHAQTESDNFKFGNSENLEKEVLSNAKAKFHPITNCHIKVMSAKHLEDIEICTPLNELSQNNSHNQRKKKRRHPIMAFITGEPTEIFWQKLRLHLPIRQKDG